MSVSVATLIRLGKQKILAPILALNRLVTMDADHSLRSTRVIISISSSTSIEMSVFSKQFSEQLPNSQLSICCNFDERLIYCGSRNMSVIKTSVVWFYGNLFDVL